MGRISPHDQFFSTDAVCDVCDKYEVWPQASPIKEIPSDRSKKRQCPVVEEYELKDQVSEHSNTGFEAAAECQLGS